ncbi:pentapeptide repeat-containing protein [Rhodococcus jostii]|uniref:pentapeptide repeat-containing protein n=1 Tax=Rhodococcus jostii TaxID=132919 RepID=UPI0036393F08
MLDQSLHLAQDGSNLTNAGLGYTNLTGANLTRANLTGANLTDATWINGHICGQGSFGACHEVEGQVR